MAATVSNSSEVLPDWVTNIQRELPALFAQTVRKMDCIVQFRFELMCARHVPFEEQKIERMPDGGQIEVQSKLRTYEVSWKFPTPQVEFPFNYEQIKANVVDLALQEYNEATNCSVECRWLLLDPKGDGLAKQVVLKECPRSHHINW